MISFPFKSIYGLIGAPRAGKDSVASFLVHNKGFKRLAFADKIKEEFGISKEEFERAKRSHDIHSIRKELWNFSAAKKKQDPLYFIKLIRDEATSSDKSIVISDVRTSYELDMVSRIGDLFWVKRSGTNDSDINGILNESELNIDFLKFLQDSGSLNIIINDGDLHSFTKKIDKFFFTQDILKLCNMSIDKFNCKKSKAISSYIEQFYISSIIE